MTSQKPAGLPADVGADRLVRAGRGSMLNLGGAAVSSLCAFLITVVVARAMSRGEAGVFFSVTALFLLVTGLGQLGTNTGLVYFLARDRVAESRVKPPAPASYMRIAIVPVLAAAVVMALVLGLLAGDLGSALSGGPSHTFAGQLRVVACFVVVAALGNLAFSGTRGMGTMTPSATIDQIIRPLCQLAFVAIVAAALPHGTVVAWAWAAPYLPAALLGWWAWTRLSRSRRPRGQEEPRVSASGFWRFTAPRAVSSVAQVAMQRLDIVLVAGLAGLTQAAVYAAASRFLSLGQLAAGAVGQAVQPQLGEEFARGDLAEAGRLYKVSTGWVIALTWPLYLTLIVYAGTILRIFGHGYPEGRDAVLVLCASMLVATASGMVDMVLLMAGKSSWNLYNVLMAFGLNLGLDLLLIPPLGILGAAIGWAVAIVASNLVPLVQVMVAIGVHPMGSGPAVAMASALVCFLLVPGVTRLTLGSGWSSLAIGAGAGIGCYALSLVRFRRQLRLSALVGSRWLLTR